MTQRNGNPGPDGLRAFREGLGLSRAALADRIGYSAKQIQRWESGDAAPRQAVIDCLTSLAESGPSPATPREPKFDFIDLFAGIGGMRFGFESAGGRCVYTSEWNKYARQTYVANFGGDEPIAGDIVGIPSAAIPAHDVLLAGFPCQPFSIAGVSKKNALGRPHGFACDTQGTLFFEVARILKYHRPRAFVLENVKNLVTHDRGRTFATIKKVLEEELEYSISWAIIDARSVVPQHRERIFIVGFNEPIDYSVQDVPFPDPSNGPRLRSILHPEDGAEPLDHRYLDASGRVAKKYVLSKHLWTYLQDYAAKHRAKGNGFGFGLVGPDDVARTLSARYYKDGSEILVRRGRGSPRRLTPRECARLMGFDKGAREFKIPVSDTQAYKQFGNSVVVPVVEAIAKSMGPYVVREPAVVSQLSLPLQRSA